MAIIHTSMRELPNGRQELEVTSSVIGPVYLSVAAVAARRELLGYDDPVEALEAIIAIEENGEPEPDPVTGENTWTEVYTLLAIREQAREDEADRARGDCCTEDVVVERSEKADYDAVHVPVNGGECAMDRCRREARRQLGLPDPTRKCGAETRSKRPVMPARLPVQARAMRPAGGKAQVLDVLADQADYLHACTKQFLHSLTDHDADPLEPEPEPVPTLATPAETLKKYQGGRQ